MKILYKFEMNFQLRSFGFKEPQDLQVLTQYAQNLFEISLYIIKSDKAYLREYAIGLLSAWNRICQEVTGA